MKWELLIYLDLVKYASFRNPSWALLFLVVSVTYSSSLFSDLPFVSWAVRSWTSCLRFGVSAWSGAKSTKSSLTLTFLSIYYFNFKTSFEFYLFEKRYLWYAVGAESVIAPWTFVRTIEEVKSSLLATKANLTLSKLKIDLVFWAFLKS